MRHVGLSLVFSALLGAVSPSRLLLVSLPVSSAQSPLAYTPAASLGPLLLAGPVQIQINTF